MSSLPFLLTPPSSKQSRHHSRFPGPLEPSLSPPAEQALQTRFSSAEPARCAVSAFPPAPPGGRLCGDPGPQAQAALRISAPNGEAELFFLPQACTLPRHGDSDHEATGGHPPLPAGLGVSPNTCPGLQAARTHPGLWERQVRYVLLSQHAVLHAPRQRRVCCHVRDTVLANPHPQGQDTALKKPLDTGSGGIGASGRQKGA